MPAAAAFTQGATTPAAGESLGQGVCNVLNLTLGPLDLNLLGLRVQLNQVVLNITAIPGGGLLGDLLCGLAGGPVPPDTYRAAADHQPAHPNPRRSRSLRSRVAR